MGVAPRMVVLEIDDDVAEDLVPQACFRVVIVDQSTVDPVIRLQTVHQDLVAPLDVVAGLGDPDGDDGGVEVAFALRNPQTHLDDGGLAEIPGKLRLVPSGNGKSARFPDEVPVQVEGAVA